MKRDGQFESPASILRSFRQGVMAIDLDGNLRFINEEGERLTGYLLAAGYGRSCEKLFGAEAYAMMVLRSKLFHDAGSAYSKAVINTAGGARTPITFSAFPWKDASGKLAGMIFLFYDSSGEIEREKQRHELVSMLSHELRTPLASIRGYTDIVLEGKVGPLNERQSGFLKQVSAGAMELADLIDKFLNLARIESGQSCGEMGKIEIAGVVNKAVESSNPLACKKKMKVTVTGGKSLPSVYASGDEIFHAVSNIINNAIKYAPAGGRVCVKLRGSKTDVKVSVQDNGPGIPRAERGRIFEKFYRGSVGGAERGSGLGLAIVKAIVERHGSSVELETKAGKGSTFSFNLPVFREGVGLAVAVERDLKDVILHGGKLSAALVTAAPGGGKGDYQGPVKAFCEQTVRKGDVVVDYKKDMTGIICKTGSEGMRSLLGRLEARVKKCSFPSQGKRVPMKLKWGVSTYPEDGDTGWSLVARAEQRLLKADGVSFG